MTNFQIFILILFNAFIEHFLIKWEIQYNIDLFYALNKRQVDKELSSYNI